MRRTIPGHHRNDWLFLSLVTIYLLLIGCQSQMDHSIMIDLSVKPSQAEVLAPGLISTGLYERDIAITSDRTELIYTLGDQKQLSRCLVSYRKTINGWEGPKILPFSGEHQDIEPFFSVDDQKLYFASDRPIHGDTSRSDYNIWVVDRTPEGWASPIALSDNINTEGQEFFPSVARNGNLYFTATREDGIGLEDIFVSEFRDGSYQDAVVLDSSINTSTYEFNAFVSPDETMIIFSSFARDDGFGGGDLYYSRKDENGNWSQSMNMGPKINSDKLDYCPFLDFENEVFYFTSERVGAIRVPIHSIETIASFSQSPENGFGDLYRISTDYLFD